MVRVCRVTGGLVWDDSYVGRVRVMEARDRVHVLCWRSSCVDVWVVRCVEVEGSFHVCAREKLLGSLSPR